ncbi:hypothetical protein [Winogradskyella forsetii]|uniref:hypothetical protein n=1 Tax=Winogradskyella forsetii TaxID=2686077 RepID=UPI0015C0E8E5|nr:hypothetical protein [Winogradskyella forsetii]
MKTKQLFFKLAVLCTVLIFSSTIHSQTTWRVNNQSNYDGATLFGENYGGTPSYPVFSEIDEAIAYPNVVDGDTLHIEGSTIVYEDATITKQLVIIGPGYFLTENENVSNNTYDAKLSRINFNSGSEFSQIIGMNIINDGLTTHGTIYINVNEITVKRCRIERDIQFATQLSGAYILQNFFSNIYNTNAIVSNGLTTFIPPQDVIFNNNICQKRLVWSSSSWGTGTLLECNNNIFDGPENELNLEFNTGSFQNNILKAPGITANINSGTNNNVQYNTVSLSSVFTGTTENLWVPSMATLFVADGTTDGNYQLQSDSTFNVVGSDGTERGAFGGIVPGNRYNLSGLGAIPVVYEVTTTGVSEAGTGLPVTIQARTNN